VNWKLSAAVVLLTLGVLSMDRTALGDAGEPTTSSAEAQLWNFHIQNTDAVQGVPAFSAAYSGPNSLSDNGEVRESLGLDLFAGLRLWKGAEFHVDGLAWQGFGLDNTEGVEDFPNAASSKAGTRSPDFSFARLFIRQTIGLGGDQEDVTDDQLTLAGKQDVSRLTFTIGRLAPTDVFDTNAYANNAATQFMNWAFTNNVAWDYAADSIGFTTGFSLELNEPSWTLRYGFYQMPSVSNAWTVEDAGALTYPAQSPAGDGKFWKSWEMPVELELRYSVGGHPGALRPLAWVCQADMGSYGEATLLPGANIVATRAYRYKYGFGLNWEQEVASGVGIFSRLGWNDGHEEAWAYTDVNYSASVGMSVGGASWHRPNDTIGLAGVISGASRDNQRFLEAGGSGILDGDGALDYGWEKVVEAYYDFDVWSAIHLALDYQYVVNPAFNADRGPASVIAVRVHWQF
jgi:high affinity Mn2+ porin